LISTGFESLDLGVLEWWSIGLMINKISNLYPLLQSSITPTLRI
jgi:hypothetical protein